VKILYPYAGKGDRSFSDLAFEGLFRAMQQVEVEKVESVPDDHDAAELIISSWLLAQPEERELIVVIGFSYADVFEQRDWELSGHSLLFVDGTAPMRQGLLSAAYRTFAPSYLAGLAGAHISTTKKLSAIGGMSAPPVNSFIDGFRAGAESGGAEFIRAGYLAEDATGFSMVPEARNEALSLVSLLGVDVILPVAGGSGLGVIEAAHESEGALLVAGVDSDQSYLGQKLVIGSVVKRIDRIVSKTIVAAAEGHFSSGALSLGIETGDTDFVINSHFAERINGVVALGREQALAAEAVYASEGAP
jgi:basic membrane protein A